LSEESVSGGEIFEIEELNELFMAFEEFSFVGGLSLLS